MVRETRTYKTIGEFYDAVTNLSLEKGKETLLDFIGKFSIYLPLKNREIYCFEPFGFSSTDSSKVLLTLTTNGLSGDHPFEDQYSIRWWEGPSRTQFLGFSLPIEKDSWIAVYDSHQNKPLVRGNITVSRLVLDLIPELKKLES